MTYLRISLVTLFLISTTITFCQKDIPGSQGEWETMQGKKKLAELPTLPPFAKYKGKVLVKGKTNNGRYDSAVRVRLDIDLRAFSEVVIDYNGSCVKLYYINPDYLSLFEKGIFYPLAVHGNRSGDIQQIPPKDSTVKTGLFGRIHPDSLSISYIEELLYTDLSPTIKRFKCYIYQAGIANPNLHVFELRNDKATKETSLAEFISGAALTQFEFISVLL